ncbi:MAG: dienelactone hydrolase family protein [Brevundimonas sp.]|nr:dienelactone hydrolase family protein [Brevundimonas sp.]
MCGGSGSAPAFPCIRPADCTIGSPGPAITPTPPCGCSWGRTTRKCPHDRCQDLIRTAAARGHDVEFVSYRGATHSFDDPGRRRQSVAANARATEDVRERLGAFFDEALAPRTP